MTSTTTLKRLTLLLNAVCVILALVLITFGVYVLCSYNTNGIGTMAVYSYIGIGVVGLISLPLCITWTTKSVCRTVTFLIFLYISLLAQLAVMIFLTREVNAVASNLANDLDTTWEEELRNPGAMALYEEWFTCCGRASPHDYVVNDRLPPATCFKNHEISVSTNLIEQGCRIEFEAYWLHLLDIFNIIAWVLIAIEFIGSFFICCLCNSTRNDQRRSYF